jgi:hypothetical protein
MSGTADIRIDRLVIEGRTLTRSEASRLTRLIAAALSAGPLPRARTAERILVGPGVDAGTGRGTGGENAGQFSLERLARLVADDIRRKLA